MFPEHFTTSTMDLLIVWLLKSCKKSRSCYHKILCLLRVLSHQNQTAPVFTPAQSNHTNQAKSSGFVGRQGIVTMQLEGKCDN